MGKRQPFRVYCGMELRESKKPPQAIVDGLLYDNDLVIVFSKAKMFKSLFTMQMCMAVSSGSKFLGTFGCKNPAPVWYFATEGKDEEIKNRYIRMAKKVDAYDENFVLICCPDLRINTEAGVKRLQEIIGLALQKNPEPPKVIVIDALYKAVKGSMKNDDTITEFLHIVTTTADMFGSAVMIVHHKTKDSYSASGDVIDRGDESMYGSSFLINAVDHAIVITGSPEDKVRTVNVNTQRSGDIVDKFVVKLNEPDPLYLELLGTGNSKLSELVGLFETAQHPLTVKAICDGLEIGRTCFYENIKVLIDQGVVGVQHTRPAKYFSIKRSKSNFLDKKN